MDPLIHAAISATIAAKTRYWHWRRIWPYIFWGVIPDLYQIIFLALSAIGIDYFNNFYNDNFWLWYNPSHSLVVALGVFILISISMRRWYWPLTMWSVHVVCDIVSHQFHRTPFLWPLSNFKVMGWFDYTKPLSLIITYGIVVICAAYFFWRRSKKNNDNVQPTVR